MGNMYNAMSELEQSIADLDSAMEGMFASPETTVETLLNKVRENLVTKVTTVAAAEELLSKINAEAVEISKCLNDINAAIADARRGAISKDEAKALIVPCVQSIKTKCTALGLTSELSAENDICECEVEMIREFTVGCQAIIEEHRAALADEEGADQAGKAATLVHGAPASESYLYDEDDEEAMEAAGIAFNLYRGNEMKAANAYFKQAKGLYRAGSKEKAVASMAKAKKMYEAILVKAKKLAKPVAITRTDKISNLLISTSTSYKDTDYKSISMFGVIEHLYERIDSCQAWIMKWTNKAGAKSVEELKAQLKEEKKAERQRVKEELRAAKAAKKEQKSADKVAKAEAKAAAKAAKKAAKNGDMAAATEALIAMIQYATEGELDLGDELENMAMEGTIMSEMFNDGDDDDMDLDEFED